MSEKNSRVNNNGMWSVSLLTLVIFVPVMSIAVALTVYFLSVRERADFEHFCIHANSIVEIQSAAITQDIKHVTRELDILANQKEVLNLWKADGTIDHEVLSELEKDYFNVAKYRGLYDQVRLLDEQGMEIIRVNYNNGQPSVVPLERLQNKKGRYYFDDAFRLDRGEIFVSPFDLNVEQGAIEEPLKPMIRFATPVYDRYGNKRGLVLLNYLGARILENLYEYHEKDVVHHSTLLNRDGYWLKGTDADHEWGFMHEDRMELTIAKEFPQVWKQITSNNYSQAVTSEGLFTSTVVYPLPSELKSSTGSNLAAGKSDQSLLATDYYWIVLHHIPTHSLNAVRDERRKIAALFLFLIGTVLLAGALTVAKLTVHRRQAETARMQMIEELQRALSQIKILDGLLPICSHCKKIRDDKGYWNQLEAYIGEHSGASFSHSICQDCAQQYYPDLNLYEPDPQNPDSGN